MAEREDRCERSRRQRDRADDGPRHQRGTPQRANTVTKILEQRFEPGGSPRLATLLFELLDPAEDDTSAPRGVVARHSRRDVFLDLVVDMEAQFIVELPFDRATAHERSH